ncbi:hypothetical protein EDB89DRAFT_2014030 [Lactarius sanguifluus]|nr:hypothetical protein EDB89DRAFT_2014030 [Lactarius sanguifluus]
MRALLVLTLPAFDAELLAARSCAPRCHARSSTTFSPHPCVRVLVVLDSSPGPTPAPDPGCPCDATHRQHVVR